MVEQSRGELECPVCMEPMRPPRRWTWTWWWWGLRLRWFYIVVRWCCIVVRLSYIVVRWCYIVVHILVFCTFMIMTWSCYSPLKSLLALDWKTLSSCYGTLIIVTMSCLCQLRHCWMRCDLEQLRMASSHSKYQNLTLHVFVFVDDLRSNKEAFV